MRIYPLLLIPMVVAVGCTSPTSTQTSQHRHKLVDGSSKPLSPESFREITINSTLDEVLKQLGPAKRDGGSGLTYLIWECTDGRFFWIGFSQLDCSSKPLTADFTTKGTFPWP
jgi:hypothetical protein